MMETNPDLVADGMIRVEQSVYSAQKLAAIHPGGPLFIKAFAGRDASQAFLTYHRRPFPHGRAKAAFHHFDSSVTYSPDDNGDFLDLCERIEKILPRMRSFAPRLYFVKVGVILGLAFGLELYIHWNRAYVWYLTSLVGLLFALIGLNIQHDANHGAISSRPWINRALGLSQNWIGGSSISWIHQHVVQHHIHTNDIHRDPDISGNFCIRLNPLQPLLRIHFFQYLYFFLLLGFYGFVVIFQSLGDVLSWKHFTPMSSMLLGHRKMETMTSLLFLIRWVAMPILLAPSHWMALLHTLPMYIVGGYYLAFFFTISHNFSGVHMLDDTRRQVNGKRSFLFNQVVSSSNVGGSLLCFLNGGLNYQIEHHLFPRINHTHYPKIAPIVKQFCLDKNIPYVHFQTLGDNVSACVQHLVDMGVNQKPQQVVLDLVSPSRLAPNFS